MRRYCDRNAIKRRPQASWVSSECCEPTPTPITDHLEQGRCRMGRAGHSAAGLMPSVASCSRRHSACTAISSGGEARSGSRWGMTRHRLQHRHSDSGVN
jgi:hypothetical protein